MKKVILYIVMLIFMFSCPGIAGQGNQGRHKQGKKYQTQQRHHNDGYRYQYRGHRQHPPKHYRGHWNSWRSWENHYHHNHHRYRNHRYYRDHNGSLYFGFETDEGSFSFSIGR